MISVLMAYLPCSDIILLLYAVYSLLLEWREKRKKVNKTRGKTQSTGSDGNTRTLLQA